MNKEIIGTVDNIIFESEDSSYKVIEVETDDEFITIVGFFPYLEERGRYSFTGNMSIHDKYGLQLKCEEYHSVKQNSKKGLINYLSGPNFRGIGEKTAVKIVEELGIDAIDKIIDDYKILLSIKGITEEKAKSIKNELYNHKNSELIFITLYSYGLSYKLANKIFSKYQDETLQKINENPYQLIYDFEFVGFLTADKIALSLGFDKNNKLRIKEAIIYVLTNQLMSKGHTFLPINELITLTVQFKEDLDIELIKQYIDELCESQRLVKDDVRIYPKYLYDAEKNSAKRIKELIKDNDVKVDEILVEEIISEIEIMEGITFTPNQKRALMVALTHKVSIITGGPGTGKTTILKGLITAMSIISRENMDKFKEHLLLLSPTGKAAKRMANQTKLNAMTIHRALGYNLNQGFTKGLEDKLSEDIIIIDESSMIDITLLSHLLDAITKGSRLVFVGDMNQLPSVSPGNVLNDLISTNMIPTIYLTDIMRQKKDSNIIKLSQMVNNRTLDFNIFKEKKEVFFFNSEGVDVCQNIEKLLNNFIAKGGNLIEDMQILVPMYSGPCGIDEINKMVQEKYNKSNEFIQRGNKIYKVNDKVLQLQNRPELEIMNGDEGIIKGITQVNKHTYLYIEFNGKMIKYDYDDLDNLDLAYAISIHKSQGSEYKNIIMPIVPAFSIMLRKKVLYTAITRAIEKVIILGKPASFEKGVLSNDDVRYTSLTRFITDKKEEHFIEITDPESAFDQILEEDMEDVTPYDFMDKMM